MDGIFLRMDEMSEKTLWIHQTKQTGRASLNGFSEETGLERVGQTAVFKKIENLEFKHPDKLRNG